MEIGNIIKQKRFKASMTQEQLAEKLGISPQSVSKWENEISMPDIALLPEIAEVFGVSVDELFGLNENEKLRRIENRLEFEEPLPGDVFWEYEEYLNGEEFADEFDDEDEFADVEVPAIDRRINRGVAGMWKLTDDGTFELQEPFRTMLTEARVEATRGWTAGLIGYLEPRCNYTAQELTEELLRRNRVREDGSIAVFEEFVLEALGGDL